MRPPSIRLGSSRYAPGTRHPLHSHEELQITLVLRGGVSERVGERVEEAAALSVVVKDPGVMHADDFSARGALTIAQNSAAPSDADFHTSAASGSSTMQPR